MLSTLFIVTLAAEMLLLVALAASVYGWRRVWPPPGRRSWEFWGVWSLTGVTFVGILAVGVLDRNALGLPGVVRFGVGLPLTALGLGLAFWALGVMGWHRASGLTGELVDEGPYRFSRNPQYLGDAVALVGWSVWSGSAACALLSGIAVVLLVATPFAEEPWLAERLGDAYRRYRSEVPRFF